MRYLIRCDINLLDNNNSFNNIINNGYLANNGCLLFPYGISNILMKDGDTIEYLPIGKKYISNKEYDNINSKFDCVILPLNDCFWTNYIPVLEEIINFIKHIKIPVVVCSMAKHGSFDNIKHNEEMNIMQKYIKEFMHLVLSKSNIIGVRDENTGQWLSDLGYIDGKDFEIIGCPSMFSRGNLIAKFNYNKSINTNSKVAVNLNLKHIVAVDDKQIFENTRIFENINYFPSNCLEFKYLLEKFGNKYFLDLIKKSGILDSGLLSKTKSYVNVNKWIQALSNYDFCFGMRIHGCIASVLAGIPTIVIAIDPRMYYLAKYHNIPVITYDQLKDQDILAWAKDFNFNSISESHEKLFVKYLNFLYKNNLQTVYEENINLEQTPFKKLLYKN